MAYKVARRSLCGIAYNFPKEVCPLHSIQKKRLAAAVLTCAVLHQQSVPQPLPIPVQNNTKPDLTLHFLHAPAISQLHCHTIK
ncbi:hypothetical protein [Ruminococcus callidus]|jgi:hypothetical protein|uniref:hypothetical protein n=1 Tax=Ruminococcus callidus TaxID=40519 RepID=UPI003521E831